MIKPQAPASMVAAVRQVPPAQRLAAAQVAEKAFAAALTKLASFADFSEHQHRAMAAEAAAAEVAFLFPSNR